MSKFTTASYGGTKEIRKHTHSVEIPFMVTSTTTGVQTNEAGEKYIPAGTILPSNDTNAVGVVLNDTVVQYGDCACSLVIHGFIDLTKLPTAPAAAAKTALKLITFL